MSPSSGEAALAESVRVELASVTPTPSDEELAAIVAALELAWPRPVVAIAAPPSQSKASSWRWSGRWWNSQNGLGGSRRP